MRHQYEVKQVNRRRQNLFRLLRLLLVLGLMFGSYKLGEKALGIDSNDVQELKKRIVNLNHRLSEATERSRELNEEKIQCERQGEFDKKDVEDARQSLADLQRQLVDVNRELGFYQRLLDPVENNSNKLAVHSFKLQAGDKQAADSVFYYELVLNQFRDSNNIKTGVATVQVVYSNGKNRNYNSPYKFKFYQRLKGKIVIKQGDVVAEIVIKLQPDKGLGATTKTYSWESLIRGTK